MGKNALDIALHFLKFRPRSEFEIRQKLLSKKISEKEIDNTINVLMRNKLLDDTEFAKMYVRDRNRFRPSGAFVLRLELKKLGISEIDIDPALSDQDEEMLAREALESKHKYCHADFEKKAQFLQRRGFSMNIIMKILKDINSKR
jgi:regulatory protein